MSGTIDVCVEYQWHSTHAEYIANEYHWDLGAPVGYGKTEAEALDDLREQLAEHKSEAFTLNVIRRENFNSLCPSGWSQR